MKMTQEEYEKLTNSISNEEVAGVMFDSLLKIHMKLEGTVEKMTSPEEWKYGLFKSFFKLYNTTLRLSESSSYVFRPDVTYTDIKAINIQIRSCHELYLLFQYITTNTISDGKHDEIQFKYECYRLSGALDSKRTYEKIKMAPDYIDLYKKEIGPVLSEISESRKFIRNSPVYNLLKNEIKTSVCNGYWRISAEKKLSWNDLLEYTPMPREYGSFEYHVLSMYAHSSLTALKLEANHDYDMIGTLSHLYKLSALMCLTTLNAFNIDLSILTDREIALIIDLRSMGNNTFSAQK
ncbi:TPA: hypothetical protein ACJCGJ_000974 [Klebsiella pneumoniae]|jgi:hypothetical protein|uniref:hypothetical protein n=1 Tax=Klebsiella pneumoniae TaxID=573 RepID=UPI002AC6D88B|nr:hypothetical protein [Klebsiella pneumoniae]